MIKAFIFDLDGTLLDTEILWVKAYIELLRRNGLSVRQMEAFRIVYGRSFNDVHLETIKCFPNLGWDSTRMLELFRAIFLELGKDHDLRIPGSIFLLKKLARQYPVCLVSGSSRADVNAGIRLAGITGELRFTLSSEDYKPGKPDPAGFLEAAGRLSIPPIQCLVFEDSANGVTASKAAGMWCVALARSGRPAQDFSNADLILDDLSKFSLSDFLLRRSSDKLPLCSIKMK